MTAKRMFACVGALLGALLLSACGGSGDPAPTTQGQQGGNPPPPATAAGSVGFSSSTFGTSQSSKTVSFSVARSDGADGAVSVSYATADGTAKAGSDYTAANGMLSWADGDASPKSFSVAISDATPFSGSRAFTVSLSAPSGGVTLGAPSSATATISGSATASACAQNSSSWTTTGAFDSKAYGNYFVNNNNWGGTPGQKFWSNDENCWGVTTNATRDSGAIGSYPSVTRGWSQNQTIMQQ